MGISSSSCVSAGIGTLLKAGCRGVIGPIPQPLLIRQYSIDIGIIAPRCPVVKPEKAGNVLRKFSQSKVGSEQKIKNGSAKTGNDLKEDFNSSKANSGKGRASVWKKN